MLSKNIFRPLIQHLKLSQHQKKWRKLNSHNLTEARSVFPVEKVSVGKYTYGGLDISFFGDTNEKIIIGNFCSIAGDVKILAGGGHDYYHLSTFPIKKLILNEKVIEATTKGPIKIEDDVWIGQGAMILSGVTIGQGAIIGARSIVSKDVSPYAIYVGDRVIKHRFSEAITKKLIKFDYSEIKEDALKENLDLIYSDINKDFFESDFYKTYSIKGEKS